MNKTVVIYQSKYGTTQKYANWIADATGADLIEKSNVDIHQLAKYDTLIYGGGLYASGILGASIIVKHYAELKHKNIIVFTVGMESPEHKEAFIPIIEKNFPADIRKNINFFHFRGGINYAKLNIKHKIMMKLLQTKVASKRTPSEQDKAFLATYGKKIDFTDKTTIAPLLEYLKQLKN